MTGTRSSDRAKEFPQHSSTSQPPFNPPLQKIHLRLLPSADSRSSEQSTSPPRSPASEARLLSDDEPPAPPTHRTARSVAQRKRGRPPIAHWRPSNRRQKSQQRRRQRTGTPLETLKMLQLNVCGLRIRASEIAYTCGTKNIDIVCLQETHLKPNDPHPSLLRYTVISRQDRTDGYGGVIIYVHQCLKDRIICSKGETYDTVQLCQVKPKTPRGPLEIANVYAAPGWETTNPEWINTLNPQLILVGDVNAKGSWDPNAADKQCRAGEILEESLNQAKLVVLNDRRPTRTSRDLRVARSSIDVTAACARWFPLMEWSVNEHPTTDHHAIFATINTGRPTSAPKKKRWALRKADWDKFRTTLDRSLPTQLPTNATLEEESAQLTLAIIKAAKASVPKGRRPKEVPWWNEEIDHAIEKRQEAWHAHLRRRTQDTADQLVQRTEEATTLANHLRPQSWRNTLDTLSPHDPENKLWRICKGLRNKGSRNTPKAPPGKENLSDRKKATWFLKQCIAKCKRTQKDTTHRNEYRNAMDSTDTRGNDKFTMKELEHVTHRMDSSKTGGPDDIQIMFLKELSPTGKERLLKLLNRSYQEGDTPSTWRTAEIVAIEKPGKPGQFRPISLTNVIARCMERLLLTKLQPWPKINFQRNKLDSENIGPAKNRSQH